MKSMVLKSVLALSCGLVAVATAYAAPGAEKLKPFADADHVIYAPTKFDARIPTKSNITYHGGGVIVSAKVVYIFWGPNFNNAASADYSYARTLQAFRNQFGTTGEYNTITQYSGIQLANLGSGTADWFDTTTPPTNVTDSTVQAEVNRYFSGGHGAFNTSTIYEVVIPKTSYSSSGSAPRAAARAWPTAPTTARTAAPAAPSSTPSSPTRAAPAARSPAGLTRRMPSTSSATRPARP